MRRGTTPHLAADAFNRRAGLDMVHVPYRGSTAAMTDVIGGNIPMTFVSLGQYIERVQGSISEFTFWVGLIKAPVFAALIAVVGTLRGMQVRSSSRELGRLTTVAVVQSIFLVILADAVFAVIFMELDI